MPAGSGWPEVTALFELLASVNWMLLFVVSATAIPIIYLHRVSNDDSKTWRWEQLVSDENGEAYSPSFTYMGTFCLGYLTGITLLESKEWGYILGLLGTLVGTFAIVSALGRSSKAKVQIEKTKAEQGIVDPVPIIPPISTVTTETTRRETEVTQ